MEGMLCKRCGVRLSPEDRSPGRTFVRCGSCNAIWHLPGPNQELPDAPESFRVVDSGANLLLQFPWSRMGSSRWARKGLIGGAILIAMFFASGIFPPTLQGGGQILLLLLGYALIWFALARYFNRTTIGILGDQLRVRYGPLPIAKGRDVPLGSVGGFYCEERLLDEELRTKAYDLYAVLRTGGEPVPLAKGLVHVEEALFLAANLDSRLARQRVVPEEPEEKDDDEEEAVA